jgi:hypothetical protein
MVIEQCPFCQGKDFKEVKKKDVKALKCTACGRLIPEVKPCDGEACKV